MTTTPKTWTVAGMMTEGPCYTRARVQELWGRRKSLSLRQILTLKIPARDRMWVVWRPSAVTLTQRNTILERIVTRAVRTHAGRNAYAAAAAAAAAYAAAAAAAADAAAADAYAYAAAREKEYVRQIEDTKAVLRS